MDRIPIQLDEHPTIPPIIISATGVMEAIIAKATEAQRAQLEKRASKIAAEKIVLDAMSALLEAPAGISAVDLLVISESEKIGPLILKIRNRLKKDNLYTLEKRGQGKSAVYQIQDLGS